MFDPHKDQWWNQPPESITEAYYMTLRVHYSMPALEAWNYLKKAQAAYPGFMFNPIGTLQEAVGR